MIELILMEVENSNPVCIDLEFSSLGEKLKEKIKKIVTSECNKYVEGALYGESEIIHN